jgi:hypothetical protein
MDCISDTELWNFLHFLPKGRGPASVWKHDRMVLFFCIYSTSHGYDSWDDHTSQIHLKNYSNTPPTSARVKDMWVYSTGHNHHRVTEQIYREHLMCTLQISPASSSADPYWGVYLSEDTRQISHWYHHDARHNHHPAHVHLFMRVCH